MLIGGKQRQLSQDGDESSLLFIALNTRTCSTLFTRNSYITSINHNPFRILKRDHLANPVSLAVDKYSHFILGGSREEKYFMKGAIFLFFSTSIRFSQHLKLPETPYERYSMIQVRKKSKECLKLSQQTQLNFFLTVPVFFFQYDGE